MEEQSYIFDFQRTPLFWEKWNISFTVAKMKQDAVNFEVVYCTHAPNNIDDCLNQDGTLNNNVEIAGVALLRLKYDEGIISVRSQSAYHIGDSIIPLKAVFIRDRSTGFVMGYSINTVAFEVTNNVILREGTILWSIIDG